MFKPVIFLVISVPARTTIYRYVLSEIPLPHHPLLRLGLQLQVSLWGFAIRVYFLFLVGFGNVFIVIISQ